MGASINPLLVKDWHTLPVQPWASAAPRTSPFLEYRRQTRLCFVSNFHTHTYLPGNVWGDMSLECSKSDQQLLTRSRRESSGPVQLPSPESQLLVRRAKMRAKKGPQESSGACQDEARDHTMLPSALPPATIIFSRLMPIVDALALHYGPSTWDPLCSS